MEKSSRKSVSVAVRPIGNIPGAFTVDDVDDRSASQSA